LSGTAVTQNVQQFSGVMNDIVEHWTEYLRKVRLPAKQPHEMLPSLVLPACRLKSFASVRGVVEALTDRLEVRNNDELRKRVDQRIRRVTLDLAGHLDQVLAKLSDLAFDYAACRTLISSNDCFHVSPVGVMAAAACANVLAVIEALKKHPGKSANADGLAQAAYPLEMVQDRVAELFQGDIWLLDLFARTIRLASRKLYRQSVNVLSNQSPSEEAMLGGIVQRFTSISMLYKLIEADDLESWLAKKSRFNWWPGLVTFVGSDGPALRNLVIGETVPHVVRDQVGLSRGAFIRFLGALLAIEDPTLRTNGHVLIATLLWETLEQNDKLLLELLNNQKYAQTIQAAVRGIEQSRRLPMDGPFESEVRRLNEIGSCLETYDQYRALVSLLTRLKM
jgi:hypothetical protein